MKNISIYILLLAGLVGCAATATNDHMAQGLLFVNQKDFNNAVIEFQAETRSNPSATAFSNLGAAYLQLGKNNLALNAFKEGEKLNAYDPDLVFNMTGLYSVTDKLDIALIYLDRALSNGFKNYDAIRFDPDLTNLRGEPEFRSILEKHKVFLQ